MRKPKGKRPLGRPRCRWEDNIIVDLREVGCDPGDWLALAADRDQWRTYVTAVMNLRVPWKPIIIIINIINTTKMHFREVGYDAGH